MDEEEQKADRGIRRELDTDPLTGTGLEGVQGLGDDGPPPPPPDPTVLKLDSWSRRRGEEALEDAPIIRDKYAEAGYTPVQMEDAAADFVSMAFLPHYTKTKNPEDKSRSEFITALEESSEFDQMQADTVLDPVASEIASWHMSSQYIEYAQQQEQQQQQTEDEQKEAAADAAEKAAADAAEDVESLQAVKDAIGMGQGDAGENLKKEDLLAMFQRVKDSRRLKAICQYLGRFRRMAQAQQRYRVDAGIEELVGVTQGGPLEQIIPSELAGLADKNLEAETMRRIVEKEYLSFDYDGFAKRSKGPIVVVVDESGSMDGERVCMAKAIALSLYWVANYQNRWVCMVGFSGGTEGNWITIEPGQNKANELLDWLEHFWGGGTTCDVPLVELPRRWRKLGCPEGKTDVVVITDAQLNIPKQVEKDFNAWKEESKARMVTIVVGDEPGDLENVSDACFSVDDLDVENDAVKTVLSI